MRLFISATVNNKEPDYDSIKDFAKECSVPLTIGGGINNVEHIKNLLRAGADKVVINTAAYENPNIIKEASTNIIRSGAHGVTPYAAPIKKTAKPDLFLKVFSIIFA